MRKCAETPRAEVRWKPALEAILAWCEESLADAIARKDVKAMREVYENSPSGSPVKAKALEAILADAIARKD